MRNAVPRIPNDCASWSECILLTSGLRLTATPIAVSVWMKKGQIVDGDGILYVCARIWPERGELGGGGIVTTVVSNGGLARALERMGVLCTRTQVGDRYVYEEMTKRESLLGGGAFGTYCFPKVCIDGGRHSDSAQGCGTDSGA